MGSKKKSGKGGVRKHGRNRRKTQARLEPLSLLVRNRISFENYLKRTGIKSPLK